MKTIDEAAKEYISEFGDDAFKVGVEFYQKLIDVNDELPEKFTRCLVKTKLARIAKGFGVKLCEFDLGYKCFFSEDYDGFFSNDITYVVTHWRPIELV